MTASISKLPRYNHQEEVANSLTHLIGAIFALGVLIYFIVFGAINNIAFPKLIPFLIYAFFLLMMFTVSFLYHASKSGSKQKAILRIIDHTDIYFCIAGTYTPLCMYAFENTTIGYSLLGANWAICITGAILNLIKKDNKALSIISYILYIITGWLIIFVYPFNLGIPFNVFLFILLGGICYTLGAILYGIGIKKRWFHSIFHIFVLAGAVIQFIGIYFIQIF